MDAPDIQGTFYQIAQVNKQDVSRISEEEKERAFPKLFEVNPSAIKKANRPVSRMSEEEKERAFRKLFEVSPSAIKKANRPVSGLQIEVGQIANVRLPANWKEGRITSNVLGNSTYREFNPAQDNTVKFFFFYRGVKVDKASADAFHQIIEQSAHVLTASEIKSLGSVLSGKDNSNWFALSPVRSEDLNGRRVLVIQGRYKQQEVDMEGVLVDADRTGAVVQEIEYQAPTNKYQKYLPLARESFRSIFFKF